MYLIFILLNLTVVFIYLYIKWCGMRDYWTKRGVPQDPVHPIMGSLTFLQKKNPAYWMRELYNKYTDSPYVGIWVFWRKGLVVNCPRLTRQIMVKDAAVFSNRLVASGKSDPMGSLNLFTMNDPLWSYIRKRLTSVFTSSKLRGQSQLYQSKASDLVYRINYENERNNILSLRPLFSDFTTDVIGESAFGIKCESTRNTSGPMRDMTLEFEKYNTWRGLCWSSIFFFPELVDIFGFTFWPKNTNAYFNKVIKMVVAERGGYMQNTDGRKDLLDALMKLKQDSIKENKEIPDEVIISNAMVFLQGGYDTSSQALAFTVYELAYHPEYQKRVYEELIEAKERVGKDLSTEDLTTLPFLNACIKEALRKYPIMGWLDRIAGQDYEVDDKLTIPAGTVVYLNAVGMHQDPKYFPDPEEFRPERFLPENAEDLVQYTYMPFGEGPRSCIGKRFGQNTVRSGLAAVLLNFELKPLPNRPPPNEVLIEKKGLFLLPGEVLSVEFAPRKELP